MTFEQFGLIAGGLTSVYGQKIFHTKESVAVWYELLKDMDYEQVSMNAKAHMQTSPYPPTVADLRRKKTEELSELQAWDMVQKAISNSYYNSVEEFNKLPAIVQKAVGSPDVLREWGQRELKSMPVMESNFIKSYRGIVESEKEKLMLSGDVVEKIEKTTLYLK